jgi:hypothetical protein
VQVIDNLGLGVVGLKKVKFIIVHLRVTEKFGLVDIQQVVSQVG